MSNVFSNRVKEDSRKRRIFPMRESDESHNNIPKQPEPLFPKEILEPIFHKFMYEWKKTGNYISPTATDFYRFLLEQKKS